ncbi:MAG TPA: hydroxyacid dehydrogenase [Caldithrix abyssi]|uniref:Hydroxyacid dehydrogenase n=1 Tax=Caldithrix abyssi TaxID=187145 RepID=A0A7V1LLS7_CALAY|nr:hydroxyacid dehydrogenase [Caldithrix abyssi]
MYRILVTDPLEESALKIFEEAPDVYFETRYGLSEDELIEKIKSFNAVLIRSATQISAKIIQSAENLKVIGRAGSGLDNVDVAAAEKKGIKVLNTPGTNAPAVAEMTIAYLFALARSLPRADHSMKKGLWEKKSFSGIELNERILGIIGCGTIGKSVARKARALGMHILVYNRSRVEMDDLTFDQVPLEELLKRSDFVSIHLALSENTRSLIGKKELALMKKEAYLINSSRGEIVDEGALLARLEEGLLAGAALDVFTNEPDYNKKLAAHEKVIATPHIGAATRESQQRVGVRIADLTLEFLRSKYIFL